MQSMQLKNRLSCRYAYLTNLWILEVCRKHDADQGSNSFGKVQVGKQNDVFNSDFELHQSTAEKNIKQAGMRIQIDRIRIWIQVTKIRYLKVFRIRIQAVN